MILCTLCVTKCSMFTSSSHGHYDYNNRNEGSQRFSFKATSVFKRYFSLFLPCFSLYFFYCVSCSCLLGHSGLAQALHSFVPKCIPFHIVTHIHYVVTFFNHNVLNNISDSVSHIMPKDNILGTAIILWSCCTLLRKYGPIQRNLHWLTGLHWSEITATVKQYNTVGSELIVMMRQQANRFTQESRWCHNSSGWVTAVPPCVSWVLAAIGDNDRSSFMAGSLVCLYAEVRCHIIVCGAGAGRGAAASEAFWLVEVLQSVTSQGVGCVFV